MVFCLERCACYASGVAVRAANFFAIDEEVYRFRLGAAASGYPTAEALNGHLVLGEMPQPLVVRLGTLAQYV